MGLRWAPMSTINLYSWITRCVHTHVWFLSYHAQKFSRRCLLHADVGKEFLAGILTPSTRKKCVLIFLGTSSSENSTKKETTRKWLLKWSSVDKVLLPRGKLTRIVKIVVLTVQRYKLIMKVPNYFKKIFHLIFYPSAAVVANFAPTDSPSNCYSRAI